MKKFAVLSAIAAGDLVPGPGQAKPSAGTETEGARHRLAGSQNGQVEPHQRLGDGGRGGVLPAERLRHPARRRHVAAQQSHDHFANGRRLVLPGFRSALCQGRPGREKPEQHRRSSADFPAATAAETLAAGRRPAATRTAAPAERRSPGSPWSPPRLEFRSRFSPRAQVQPGFRSRFRGAPNISLASSRFPVAAYAFSLAISSSCWQMANRSKCRPSTPGPYGFACCPPPPSTWSLRQAKLC